jgi:predicted enzyme related to lactoylglutathione lyase
MSEKTLPSGRIEWHDLTVSDADAVRDFYRAIVGWEPRPVPMGNYQDFEMLAPSGEVAAGICHAKGHNADLPPQWIIYISVADVDGPARRCAQLGGTVVVAPRPLGNGRFCVLRDPAGAVFALYCKS